MYYKKFLPIPELQPYISCFYLLEGSTPSAEPIPLSCVANLSCAMVFNYGDLYRITNKHYSNELLPRQFISGISSEPFKLSFSNTIGSLGVVFRLHTFKDVFRIPDLNELADRRLDLELIDKKKLDGLLDELAAAHTPEQKIGIANYYFLKIFRPVLSEKHTIPDQMLTEILDQHGFVSMDTLATKFYVSPRHLRRLFKDRMGVSPKFYARVKRFGYTYLSQNSDKKFDWRKFIGGYGYYDQAHLIREYKTFSGRTPTLINTSDWMEESPGRGYTRLL